MNWVMDTSFIIPLFLSDESSGDVDGFLNMVFQGEVKVFVPALWWYEISNALHIIVKRGRLSHQQASEALEVCRSIKNFLMVEPVEYNATIFQLAQAHNLTAYDATYLDLALQQQIGLASLDKQLNTVSKKLGIETWNLPE